MNTGEPLVNRHSHITIILLSIVVGAVLAGVVMYYPKAQVPATAQTTTAGKPMATAKALETAFVSVADQTLPAVVSIDAETRGGISNIEDFEEFFRDNPFFEPFFKEFKKGDKDKPELRRRGRSLGSGWIYREDGYIVTNSHVVRGAEKITVKLHDKANDDKEYDAKLIGTDPKTELAVIKIDAGRKLPSLKLGDSKNARVGQWVMAVGAPFQLEQTVTVGVISAKGRFLPGQSRYIRIGDVIQTDASINPGNSGGPLVNLDAEVVGINVAIVSSGLMPGNVGIGFAIPSNTAKIVVPQLIQDKKVARGWLGIGIDDLNENSRDFFGVPEGGVSVEDINEDGPASHSGLKVQDVIVAVNGEKIMDTWELQKAIAASKPGAEIALDVIRDKKPVKVKVKLGEMPGKYAGAEEPKSEEKATEKSALGITVRALTAERAEALGISRASGLVVVGVDADGPAAGKLRMGDVVIQINRTKVMTMDDLKRALAEAKKSGKKYVMVFYERNVDGDTVRRHEDIEPEW